MRSLVVSAAVIACVFGGALVGIILHGRLPDHHRDADTRDVVKLVMSLIATMAALVLSLLIVASHEFYQTQQAEMQQLGVDVILLDQVLLRYGPETQPARQELRQDIARVLRALSPVEGAGAAGLPDNTSSGGLDIFRRIQQLMPSTAAQRFYQDRAVELMVRITRTRLLIHQQANSAVPAALVVVLVSWLATLFVGFGLFARGNATVLAALLVGALSVGGAIFLIVEMSYPYSGFMHISSVPLRSAAAQIGR